MVLDVSLSFFFLEIKQFNSHFRRMQQKITEVGFIKNKVLILLLINYEVYFFVLYVF